MWKQYSVNYFPWKEAETKGSPDQGVWNSEIEAFVGAVPAVVGKLPKTFGGASVNTPVFNWQGRVDLKPGKQFQPERAMTLEAYRAMRKKYSLVRTVISIKDTLFLDTATDKGKAVCNKLNHHHGHLIIHGHGGDEKESYGKMQLKGVHKKTNTLVDHALDKLEGWSKAFDYFVYFVNCHSGEEWGVATKALEWFEKKALFPLGIYGAKGEITGSSLLNGLFQANFNNTGEGKGWFTLRGPKFNRLEEKIALVQKGYDGPITFKEIGRTF